MAATAEEKLEVHLREGQVLYVTVQEEDEGVESLDRLDAFIESLVFGPARWVWIGEAYVHNRAISAIQYGAGTEQQLEQMVGLPYPIADIPEAA